MPREYVRFPFPMEIMLEFSSGNREGRVSDLSLGGCFVDSIMDVSEGEQISLDLRLPSGVWLKLSGKIMYTMQGFGFGIQFTNLSTEQIESLEDAIRSHGGKPRAESDPVDLT